MKSIRWLVYLGLVTATAVALEACVPSPPPTPVGSPVTTPSPVAVKPCDTVPGVLKRAHGAWKDELKFPTSGKMYVESHLATTEDKALDIQAHLKRSCDLLKPYDSTLTTCTTVFTSGDGSRSFTPAEGGGNVGQGSVSKKPGPGEEMYSGNFMYASGTEPRPGEKWLISGNGKYFALSVGWETGPGDQKILGGLQKEVHWHLGTDNDSKITVYGKLKDQSLALGPVKCEGK